MGDFNNSRCKIDPIQLALLGTFITLVGDFIAFLAAYTEAQSSNSGGCNQENSQDNLKKVYTENKIKELEYEIYKLKRDLKDMSE